MSVVNTRIDARSKDNKGFEVRDSSGKLLVTVETLGTNTKLLISSEDNIRIVKTNGCELKRK